MIIGKSVTRVDATAKVTGRTRFVADSTMAGMRVAHYLRSTIAHGRVSRIDTSRARALKGVDGVFTFADVPDTPFATAGHAYSLDSSRRDREDRLILTDHIRYYGDEIAIVVAVDDLTAKKALSLIEVEYDEYRPLISGDDALAPDAREIHKGSGNCVGEHEYCSTDGYREEDTASVIAASDLVIESRFSTQMVHHCHLETVSGWAYMDDTDHVVIHSSTQIPHICRRIVAQALGMPIGRVRIVKPAIGGGFGNKQDVLLEPMLGFLATKLQGLPVRIELSREECMVNTRIRHPFKVNTRLGVNRDGTLKALAIDVLSNTGAYASHGHSIASAAGSKIAPLYPRATIRYHAKTHYSNIPAAGAMRGYGAPQVTWAVDCSMEEAARQLWMDPVDFRMKNAAMTGDIHPLSGKPLTSSGLRESLAKGRELFDWDYKRQLYSSQSGDVRRGVGVACFSYGCNTWPVSVEIAGCRMILNQDGSVNVHTGAAEIGQGSDTVIAQIAAETIGVDIKHVHVIPTIDTDHTPYDPGAFASRQSHIVAYAVIEAAQELRQRILKHASEMTEFSSRSLRLKNSVITGGGGLSISLEDLALHAYYHKTSGQQITAEASHKVTHNAYSFGCTFVEVEVDIPLCSVKILNILNVHDAGQILNPTLAKGQVQGGVGMAIAGAMSEELLINPETGKIRNNNLLDYKMPTCADLPDIEAAFVETIEPKSACGHKSLGEPPIISPAPAIRNAIWHATGVKVNDLPMGPKELFVHFSQAGLI